MDETGLNHTVHLPPELFRIIFSFAVGDNRFKMSDGFMNDERIRLSHVCSSWRSILFGMKELWSDIVIYMEAHPMVLDIVAETLSRAEGAALTIGIQMARLENHNQSQYDLIGRVIIPYAASIQNLRLFVPFYYLEALLTLPSASFPILESLSLRQSSYGVITQSTKYNTPAPSVTFPRLHAIDYGLTVIDLAKILGIPDLSFIPWIQLTTFTSPRWITAKGAYDVFVAAPNLKTMRTSFDAIGLEEQRRLSGLPMLDLPHLESLDIRFCGSHGFQLFLSLFNFPSIRDITFRETTEQGLGWSSELNNFLFNRCGSQLENVFVVSRKVGSETERFDPDAYQLFLRKHARTLRRLYVPHLSSRHDDGTVLQLMSGKMYPHLESLSLNLCHLEDPLHHLGNILKAMVHLESQGNRLTIKDLYLYSLSVGPEFDDRNVKLRSRLNDIEFYRWRTFVSRVYDCPSCAHDPEDFEDDWFGKNCE
ncbi:hypothetical protein AMATHDRAFT_60948 [Amanita thiersii Skay4041]|uniref:Uncharacterized protein n=1 Tax=Amanita thiersii Skay4041 TaxID=703135 RepID=A0A2A9NMH4_9AGAR|nr:hypothetical protein AMATHDRAFT_60948 [Amanita thiersii Skay4041]